MSRYQVMRMWAMSVADRDEVEAWEDRMLDRLARLFAPARRLLYRRSK